MTRTPPPAYRTLAAAIVLLALAGSAAPAQSAGRPDDGIDLVFLVDVSGSMYEDPNRPGGATGNDPQRIRWDAVLLSMNLLTAEDRVLIIPFNQDAPARSEDPQKLWIPGHLPEELLRPRSGDGLPVRKKIHAFVRGERGANDEWNGDIGGTAILLALEAAKDALGAARGATAPGGVERPRYVILLTDGNEASGKKPKGLKHLEGLERRINPLTDAPGYLKALLQDGTIVSWLGDYARDSRAKVYTIGLGDQFDPALLSQIAYKTGGHYRHVQTNGELIDKFRNLIWQLKGCWTKPRPIAAGEAAGREVDLTSGVRDLGTLYYGIDPRPRAGVRNSFALTADNLLTFAWIGKGGAALTNEPRGVEPAESSYTYDDYDPTRFDEGTTFVTSWKNSGSDRTLWFSKRTVVPLFKIVEPGKGTFHRFEAMPVHVHMKQSSTFRPDEFTLSAELRATGHDPGARQLATLPLTYDPKSEEFQCEVDLTRLAAGGASVDGYSLALTATGKATEHNHSLRGYTLHLPPIDFRVTNGPLALNDVGFKTFGNQDAPRQNTIRLQPEKSFPSPGSMAPVGLKVVAAGVPVDAQNRPVVDVDAAAALAVNEFGRLEGSLLVKVRDNIPQGVYKGGELLISSDSHKVVPLRVQFQVAVMPSRMGFNRSPIDVRYVQGEPGRSKELQVFVGGDRPKPGRTFTVSIPYSSLSFGKDELWLEASQGAGEKGKPLTIARPEDTFAVVFKPLKEHEPGLYSFRLDLGVNALGYVYDPEAGDVKIDYKAPTIALGGTETEYVQLGKSVIKELPVTLSGAVGAERKVYFRTSLDGKAMTPGRPEFRSLDPRAPGVELEPLDDPKVLKAVVPPSPQPLRVRLSAPRTLKCGEYVLTNGYLTAEKTDPVPVGLSVSVDDLYVTDGNGNRINGPLSFYPVAGKTLVRKVRVFAEKADLGVDDLDVAEEGPFLNVNNNVLKPHLHFMPIEKRVVKAQGRSGVEISLAFENPEASFEPYSGVLAVRCRGRNLRKDLDCAVQWVDALRTRETASAKKESP